MSNMFIPLGTLRSTLFFLTCLVMAGVSTAADRAYYTGEISAENNQHFFAATGNTPVKTLQITSPGGEVEAGIELGRWVFANQLDVEVVDHCLSSCANYVFPAGKNKRIYPRAIVAWHGNYIHLWQTGLWKDDIAPRMQRTGEDATTAERRVRRQAGRLADMERAFFRHIAVDHHLCWEGKRAPYHVANYYFLSVDDMAHFGVKNVTVAEDYVSSDTSRFDVSIEYLKLKKK